MKPENKGKGFGQMKILLILGNGGKIKEQVITETKNKSRNSITIPGFVLYKVF